MIPINQNQNHIHGRNTLDILEFHYATQSGDRGSQGQESPPPVQFPVRSCSRCKDQSLKICLPLESTRGTSSTRFCHVVLHTSCSSRCCDHRDHNRLLQHKSNRDKYNTSQCDHLRRVSALYRRRDTFRVLKFFFFI